MPSSTKVYAAPSLCTFSTTPRRTLPSESLNDTGVPTSSTAGACAFDGARAIFASVSLRRSSASATAARFSTPGEGGGRRLRSASRQLALRRFLLRRQERRVFEGRGDGRSARGALAATDDERDLLLGQESRGFQRLARGTVEGLLHSLQRMDKTTM